MAQQEGMTSMEWHVEVRRLAEDRCRKKHPEIYNTPTRIESAKYFFGPPCHECLQEVRIELEEIFTGR